MSFTSGRFWSGDTKIRPEAWGPVSSVQSTIFNNADRFGINPQDVGVLFPLWEKVGKFPLNYGSLPLQPFRAGTDSNLVPWTHEGLDCVNDYRKFALQSSFGAVRFPYSGHVHLRIKNRASYGGYNYLFYFRDDTTDSRLGLNLSYGNILYFSHGDVFISSSLGSIGVDTGDVFDISVNYSPSGLDIYINGEFFTTVSGNSWVDGGHGLNRYTFLDIDSGTNYGYSNGDVHIYQHFTTELTSDQIVELSDNPYTLIQQQISRSYFIPISGDISIYNCVMSESIDVAESISRNAIFNTSVVESVDVIDSKSKQITMNIDITETLNLEEVVNKTLSIVSGISDTMNIIDTFNSLRGIFSIVSDSLNIISDSVTNVEFKSSVNENMIVNDVFYNTLVLNAIFNELSNITSSISVDNLALNSTISESVLINDVLNKILTGNAIISNSLNITDVISRSFTFDSSIIEILNIDDNLLGDIISVIYAIISDNLSISDVHDVESGIFAKLFENISIESILNTNTQFIDQLIEYAIITDINNGDSVMVSSILDTLTILDDITGITGILANILDNVNILDTSSSKANLKSIIMDNIIINDTKDLLTIINVLISNDVTLSSSFLLDSGILNCLISNVLNIVDNSAVSSGILSIISDNFNLSDNVLSSIISYIGMFDNVYINDETLVVAEYNAQISNIIELSETIAKIAILHASMSQNFDVSDIIIESSQLPNGAISVAFNIRTTNVAFNVRTTNVVFNISVS